MSKKKKCSKCGKMLKANRSSFYYANNPDGYDNYCINCRKTYSATHYRKNRQIETLKQELKEFFRKFIISQIKSELDGRTILNNNSMVDIKNLRLPSSPKQLDQIELYKQATREAFSEVLPELKKALEKRRQFVDAYNLKEIVEQ